MIKKVSMCFSLLLAAVLLYGAQCIERVSLSSAGAEGNGGSRWASINTDGRYVSFTSYATDLVPGNPFGEQAYVYDRQTGVIEAVSLNNSGDFGTGGACSETSVNADGRFVAFQSGHTNLVAGDTNNLTDIFVYDRQTDTIEMVSVNNSGVQGNEASRYPSITPDGRYVAFDSYADNLVAGDTNGVSGDDVFVYDRQTSTIERVSVDSAGNQAGLSSGFPNISADGQIVVFSASASDLVAGDTNGVHDIFVHDCQTGVTERVSVDSAGNEGNDTSPSRPDISGDGRCVVFNSYATNLVIGDNNGQRDAFVHDRQTGVTERVSVNDAGVEGNGSSYGSSISADGRYVVVMSDADNLVGGDTNGTNDVFVYDRQTDTIRRVSVSDAGEQGNGGTYTGPAVSADGLCVAFVSSASNLIPGDSNGYEDIFASYACAASPTPTVTVTHTPTPTCEAELPVLSVKAVVDPENSDYVTVNVKADKPIDCATLYLVVVPHSASHDPVTVTSFSKVDDTTCEGTYHRNQGFGDVKTITAYAQDPCGNLFYSDGTFEREIISDKPVALAHNRINPTVPGDEAVLQYRLSQTGRVQIEIFNKRGRLACTLVDREVEAGTHQLTWAGKNDKGETVASGIYFITIRTSEYTVKERIVVIK